MSDTVSAAHILLMYAGSMRSSATRSQDEAKAKIEALKSELDGGADFGELAKEHSDCPSGADGGSLGTFGKGQMVKEFEDTTFAMDVDAISDVVVTDFGYHLIKRTG